MIFKKMANICPSICPSICMGLILAPMLLVGQEMQSRDCGLPNPSARPQSRQCNVDVFADLLYWHTSQTSEWTIISAVNENSQSLTHKVISFDWDPGFRVGIGYNMMHDGWDTQFAYSEFHTKAKDSVKPVVGEVLSDFLGNRTALIGTYQSGSVNWKLDY